MRILPVLALLAACLPEPVAGTDTGTTGDGGDGGDGGGDGGDGGDAGADHVGGTLQLVEGVDAPTSSGIVALVSVQLQDGFELGEIYRANEVADFSSGSAEFGWGVEPTPAAEWTQTFAEGVDAAVFLVGAWDDQDGNSSPDSDDVMIGASPQLLVFLSGDVSGALGGSGAQAGWNLFDLGAWFEGELAGSFTPFDIATDQLLLETNLFAWLPTGLDGRVDGSVVRADTAALFSMAGWCDVSDRPADPTLVSTALGASSFAFEGGLPAPQPDHFNSGLLTDCGASEDGVFMVEPAVYLGVGFEDADEDGKVDEGEEVMMSSTSAEHSLVVSFLHPLGLEAVLYLAQGGRMGWNLVEIDGADGQNTFVDWTDGLTLAQVDEGG